MGIEGGPQMPNPKEELQRKMAELKEKIQGALKQRQEELTTIYTEDTTLEGEKEKLDSTITQAQQEIEELQRLSDEATDAGVPMEETQPLLNEANASLEAMYAEKDKLNERQAELMGKAQTMADNPEVMGRVHEEALAENEKRDGEEKIKEALASALDEIAWDLTDMMLTDEDSAKYYGTVGIGRRAFAGDLTEMVKKTLKNSENIGDIMTNLPAVAGKGNKGFEMGMRHAINFVLDRSDKLKEYFALKEGKQ